jgi:hypothetical protein
MAALSAIIGQKVNLSCWESSDGYLSVRVSGGQAPYILSWEDSDSNVISTNVSARGLSAGLYSCVVTDSLSATVTVTATLTQPSYEEPIPEIGMSVCALHNCFLKIAACQVGNLSYKYFLEYPSQGIECSSKQQGVIWLINAIDDLRSWYPEGYEIENGITAEFTISKPTLGCIGGGLHPLTIAATLVSSVDGAIASFPATDYDAADNYNLDIAHYFYTVVNSLENYTLTLDPLSPLTSGYIKILACGTQYNGNTITLNMVITNLDVTCVITDLSWTVTPDGGTYTDEQGDAYTCETEEPCLTAEQAGAIVEKIKELTQECNVSKLADDTVLTY